MNLNKVFIIGNLTRDPELRQIPSGQAVVSFGVATNRFYIDSSGQKQKQTEFHNVVAWGRNAEIISQYLRKGSSIMVEGRLQTRNWIDQQGVKHWRTEIIAERIQLGPRTSGFIQDASSSVDSVEESSGMDTIVPQPQEPPIVEQDAGDTIDVKDIPF